MTQVEPPTGPNYQVFVGANGFGSFYLLDMATGQSLPHSENTKRVLADAAGGVVLVSNEGHIKLLPEAIECLKRLPWKISVAPVDMPPEQQALHPKSFLLSGVVRVPRLLKPTANKALLPPLEAWADAVAHACRSQYGADADAAVLEFARILSEANQN
jgi:hypothetical protein